MNFFGFPLGNSCHLLANGGAVEILYLIGIVGVVIVLVPVVLIEGLLLRYFFGWKMRRALVNALIINAVSTVAGAISLPFRMDVGMSGIPAGIGLSVWQCYHYWLLIILGLWLVYLVTTVPIEWIVLYARERKRESRPFGRRFLKAAVFINVVTYVLALPFWIWAQRPTQGSFRIVRFAEMDPEIEEVFAYLAPDETVRIATTRGEQIGEAAAMSELNGMGWARERIEYKKAKHQGREIVIGLFATEVVDGRDQPANTDVGRDTRHGDEEETGTEDGEVPVTLEGDTSLPEQDSHTASEPEDTASDETVDSFSFGSGPSWLRRNWLWRDGTLCQFFKSHFSSSASFYENVDEDWFLRDDSLEGKEELGFNGSFPPQYRLRPGIPRILPGGRYVLLECSGEIMLLDLREREAASLFRGKDPVPLIKAPVSKSNREIDKEMGTTGEEQGENVSR